MNTDKSPLSHEKSGNANHKAGNINGDIQTGFEDVVDHQTGTELRRSQRAKNLSQTDQTTLSPVTVRAKRPRRNASNISYAESSSDDGITSEFSNVNTETLDAGIGLRSRSHSPANLIISHGSEAKATREASQGLNGTARNRRAIQIEPRALSHGSIRGKSKSNRSNYGRETPYHGKPKRHPKEASIVESDGKIPPWSTLPFEILLPIMFFAAGFPYDADFCPNTSVTWLLSAMRVCKAFSEPAITVLYRDPPLWTLERPHGLLEVLKKPKNEKLFDYNVKVKRLHFDVVRSLAYTSPGRGAFDIANLIPYVPQVEEIEIFDSMQKPLLGGLGKSFRWTYSEKTLLSLEENNIHLKSWQWDANLCSWPSGRSKVDWIADFHSRKLFRSLRKVTLVNFNLDTLGSKERHKLALDSLAVCEQLSDLPDLRQLVCDSSDLVDEVFLKFVPICLTYLSLSNCVSLSAESLLTFLENCGSQLLEIHLTHNQSLNLSFLPCLGESCPVLQVLKINMNYYKGSLQDSEPAFNELIRVEEVPTWPSTLQTLEMVHLRQWSTEAATMFFTSLITAAPALPDLRRLVLKAILNIGWRDRVHFREEWIGKVEKVFKRVCPDPDPFLMTIRMFRQWKEKQASEIQLVDRASDGHLPLRDEAHEAYIMGRRSLRKRHNISDHDEDRTLMEKRRNTVEFDDLYIQGMCEVVDIRIDNLRPAESQFTEGDFLDSEKSEEDDGEWNGQDLYSD